MKNKFLILFPLLLLLTCLTGCAGKDTADSQLPPDTEVNVAVFDRISDSTDGVFTPMLMEDSLYYWKGDWDKDSKRWSDTAIYRKSGGEAEAVVIADLEDRQLLYFTVDEEQNLYCLYAEYVEEEKNLFLKKDAPDGGTIYDVTVPEEAATQILYDIDQNGYFEQGTADSLGNVVIRGKVGSLYLFGEKGEFICIGSDGCDAEKYQGADIISGYDRGVLVSDSDRLKSDGTIVIAGDFEGGFEGKPELPDMTNMKDLYVPEVSEDNFD